MEKGQHRLHLFTQQYKGLGCGWSPALPTSISTLSEADYKAEPAKYKECLQCFGLASLPKSWLVPTSILNEAKRLSNGPEADSDSDAPLSSSSSEAASDDDTDSEAEMVNLQPKLG